MKRNLDDTDSEEIREDMRASLEILVNELTPDGYEHDADQLEQVDTEARAIADYAQELAIRYRREDLDE